MNQFCHLHSHSFFSTLDGLPSPEQYAERTKELGQTHLAITDHGNIDGSIKFQKACEKHNITMIAGTELYMVPDINLREKGEKRGHVTLLVKNEIGWKNLLKLITISNLEGFYYRPRISPELLLQHGEGLIVMTACSSSFLAMPWGEEVLQKLMEQDRNGLFLEIMPHQFQEQKDMNLLCSEYSKKYNLPLIGTNDSHFLRKEDAINHEVLLCIQTKKKMKDSDHWIFKDKESYYLKTYEEMIEGFQQQGVLSIREYREALMNTMKVAEMCNGFTKIPKKEISLPLPPSLQWEDEDKLLYRLCLDGLAKIGKTFDEAYQKRLEEEFELIVEKKFVRYFLIVWELTNWCQKNNIFKSPGRGSSASSLVCYLLGITGVDPIKYNLLFARFIDSERKSMADIDQDYPFDKRQLVIRHLADIYGENNIGNISTVSIMGGKQALRDVARTFDVPYLDVDRGCKAIEAKLKGDEGYGDTIREAFEMYEDGRWFAKKYPEVSRIAMAMEGTARNKGVHASAIIIADENLRNGDRCAFTIDKDKNPVINWDKEDIEYVGLMKLDVLGLSMLSVLAETQKLVKENRDIDLDFEKITLDDEKCFKEFSKGNNIGCFQLGSAGLRKYCQQVGIDSFNTLVDLTALYRPGPLQSGISQHYIDRKKKIEEVPQLHPIYDEITKDTYNLLVYQEDIMLAVHKLAGLSWSVADSIRKDIAKSKGRDALRKYETQFVRGCIRNKTLSEEQAINLWNDIVEYGKYSFAKSHAVVYTVLTFWDMFCKLNYSTEFICALLTYGASGTDKEEKKTEYVQEAFRLGIDVRPPKVGISDAYNWVLQDNILYAPFIEIKGVGPKNAEAFRKLKTKGFYESSSEKEPVTKRFLNVLDKINAYDNIALTDEETDRISTYMGLSFVRNGLYKHKNFIKFLTENGVKIEKAKDLNIKSVDTNLYYYFGRIDEVKLSTFKGEEGKKATASISFRDDTGDFKFSFDRKFYESHISEIEHAEDSIVLIQVNMPRKSGSVICYNMWFADDLLKGEFKGLKIKPWRAGVRYVNSELSECKACQLRDECLAPVHPDSGINNVMILMESPGKMENEKGMGLVGDAGKVIWNSLLPYGYTRRDFHVSNVNKCFPSVSRTPTRKHIEACRKWIDDEFTKVKPFAVLAGGNTCIKFFTDDDAGIMDSSGKTEWNEKYGTYVCWTTHPASVLYNPENKELFEKGIKNFVDFIGGLK